MSPPPDVALPPLPLVPGPVEVELLEGPAPVDVAALGPVAGPVAGLSLELEPQPRSKAPAARPSHIIHHVILRELRCSSPFCRFKFFAPKQA
jgi:hypothetical protein